MRIKFIERIRFRMMGRAVPVIEAADIDEKGRVRTLIYRGQLKKRDNSLIATWDATGYELKHGQQMITIIDEKGTSNSGYLVSEKGVSTDIWTVPYLGPSVKSILGKYATADDIADNMDLGKSMRNVLIGVLFGAPVWWIVFQVMGSVLS